MPWYVAHTKPGKERQAVAALEQRQVEAYLPLLRKRKPRSGRCDSQPLFPGYVFACLEIPSACWLAVRSAPGVAYFLGSTDRPTALPDGFVPSLAARLELANRGAGPPRFRPGQRVLIADGPLRNLEAVFDEGLSPDGRSRVLVQLVHGVLRVQLPDRFLRVI
jgi:transcription antitermination factor NusG